MSIVLRHTKKKKNQVRFKMKSLSGNKEDFDPNKFYLVSNSYKWRVRPVDVRHNYAAGWIFIGFDYLIDFKSSKEVKKWASYKPDIKNTFNDFKIEGYKDISNSISFGGTKESLLGPRSKVVTLNPYLDHKQLKSCKIDLYFSLPKDMKEFEIYYGNKLLVNTKIKVKLWAVTKRLLRR